MQTFKLFVPFYSRLAFGALILLATLSFSIPSAYAAVAVTPATGGSSISADTNTTNGMATWTTLTGPTLVEDTRRSLTPGNGTIVLDAPSGFVFNIGAVVNATITRLEGGGNCFTFSSNNVTPTAGAITFTITSRDSTGNTRCQVVFSNIQVRPIARAPLASGDITNVGSNPSVPGGTTNYGTLTEIPGAPVLPSTGGIIEPPTRGINFYGTAFPGAKVEIVAYMTAESLRQSTTASSDGSFLINFKNIGTGYLPYGIVVTDRDGRISQSKIFYEGLLNPNHTVYVSDLSFSPTLGFIDSVVRKGDSLISIGYGVPGCILEIEVDGTVMKNVTATIDAQGFYRIAVGTVDLSLGTHTIRIRQVNYKNERSDFSPQKIFTVTNLFVPKLDFNNDGRIDIQDWSMFLFRWISPDPKVRTLDDLNGDGKVDIQDFSIFIRTLRLGQ